ncbi:MAG: hypothetical protein K6G50_12585 [bacterium]|nr:hypothetical protein [bacterium]
MFYRHKDPESVLKQLKGKKRLFLGSHDGAWMNLYGTHGFGMIGVATSRFSETSESMNARSEAVTHAELERYLFKTRDILSKTEAFLRRQRTR